MTRIFTTGAEELDPNIVWDSILMNSIDQVPIMTKAHDIDMVSAPPRTGYACYRVIAENINGLYKEFPDHPDEIYVGMAFRTTGYTRNDRQFIVFNTNLYFYIKTDNAIYAYRGGTELGHGGTVVANTWHYLEFYYLPRNSGGEVTVKLDGVQILTYSGDTTDNTEYVSSMSLRNLISNTTYPMYYDDIVINDTNGADNLSWPGQIRLLPISAKANGDANDWDRVQVDLGFNFAQSRYRSDEFAELQTPDAEDDELYEMEVPDLPAGATITNVIASVAGKIEAGSGDLALLCNPGVAIDEGTSQALVAGYVQLYEAWAVNPDTSVAWIEADLAGLQLGFRSK